MAVSERIEPYLPRPQVVRRESSTNGKEPFYDLDYDRPKSIGRLRGFQGNYGVFVRSYAYIRSLGAPGLREASETAVLNANYLLARLREQGVAEYLPAAYDRLCMHEFVLSGEPMRRELQIKTLDLAKRLLDHGVHPPTVYFPLIVEEALMVEPTETETKETLDRFAEIVAEILREAREDPEIARNAPYTTPVRRLDEAGAARHPVVRQAMQVGRRLVRFVVLGAGAIGGAVGAGLHQAGHDVALIARGEHYRAIRERGLTFERPGKSVTLEIAVADAPAGLAWDGEEVVLIATKSQDTAGALADLRAAAPHATPVVCLQNGVENERIALRLLPNVYGAVVMSPTAHLEPGVVQAYGTRGLGVIDVGRYPSGADSVSDEVASAFNDAGISSQARPDIMRFKYAKLINNVLNAVDAIVEPGPASDELIRVAQEEGRCRPDRGGDRFCGRGRQRRAGAVAAAGRAADRRPRRAPAPRPGRASLGERSRWRPTT